MHDITILKESGLLERLNDCVQITADNGHIGEEYIVTPRNLTDVNWKKIKISIETLIVLEQLLKTSINASKLMSS